MSKVAAIRALIAGATTPGERLAAEAALSRVLRERLPPSRPTLVEEALDRLVRREPVPWLDMNLLRRFSPETVAEFADWRYNPTEGAYYPPAFLLE